VLIENGNLKIKIEVRRRSILNLISYFFGEYIQRLLISSIIIYMHIKFINIINVWYR